MNNASVAFAGVDVDDTSIPRLIKAPKTMIARVSVLDLFGLVMFLGAADLVDRFLVLFVNYVSFDL